jgi:hypothetical protein
MHRGFLLPLSALALSAASALWSCVQSSPASGPSSSATGAGNSGAGGGTGGGGFGGGGVVGAGGGTLPDSGPSVHCALDTGADPVGFCTQKVVLQGEHLHAFNAMSGVAQSWDSTTLLPDLGPNNKPLHDFHDDAAYGAACSRYHQSATTYGDNQITSTLDNDLIALGTLLPTELATLPAEYAGELYQDLRTTSGGLRIVNQNALGDSVDIVAEGYGRAIYSTYYVPLGGDAGAGADAGTGSDAVLGTPAAGGGTAYASADAATGALALIDLAVRHAVDDPASSAMWQSAAVQVLTHLDARARDTVTGLYFAALVTSADPGHDALAPAAAGGPPADALLTEVNARIALALLRAQALATANGSAIPDVAALPLEARAEALLAALDSTPQSLWDPSGGPALGEAGTMGSGYFEGWVPSLSQLLTDKPTRANALAMAALHDAFTMGNGPDQQRVPVLLTLLSDMTMANAGFMTVIDNQTGYFLTVPSGFTFASDDAGVDAGQNPRQKSYFSIANTASVEGLSELWIGLPM